VPVEEQVLLGGPPERRAVRDRRAEVGVPGVEVGVEVDERDLPNRRRVTRSNGSAIVWSPPIARRWSAPSSSPPAASSICATASVMSNGLQAISPASATCCEQ
jgi:hypothetical protein